MAKELRDILPDFVHQMALDLFNESFSPWGGGIFGTVCGHSVYAY
jgi:hypothetical protein